MTNIIINAKERTIVITKKMAQAASRFGSDEYKELRAAMNDNPTYKVVVRTTKQKRETYRGLTFEYMEKYIETHDENGTIMKEFLMMRGKSEEGVEALAVSLSYSEIKNWFFDTYPAIAEFHKKREAVMERVNANKAA